MPWKVVLWLGTFLICEFSFSRIQLEGSEFENPISQSICSHNITSLWQCDDALCCQSIFIDIDIDWYSHATPTSYLPQAISIIHLSITRNPHQIQFIKHSAPLNSRCPLSLLYPAQWHCLCVVAGVCVCVFGMCYVRCLCRLSGKLLSAKSLPKSVQYIQ